MELEKFEIEAGLKEPVTLLHLSDTHICLADERDNERKNVLAAGRIKSAFGGSNEQIEQWLDEAMAFGREQADLIIHTGDLVDFVSAANLDFLKAKLKTEDVFFALGNHEFSQYVGEAKEDTAYKMQSFDMVQAASPNDLEFAVRKVGGLRLIALNNGYYFFLPEQVTALKAELAREEMPTILIMHNPIHTGELYRFVREELGKPCAYLVGTPDELMQDYAPDRYEQQKADAVTLGMIELIKTDPQIKAVLAGHLHHGHRSELRPGLPQIIAGAGFFNKCALIRVR